jgi:NAD-dependent SIR2 family protein deacetylase
VTWFELLGVLDGDQPNATHRTLGALADTGVVRAVVTTNFDTLLERTLPPGFAAVNPLLDNPPGRGRRALVKVHGSADRPRSLVDLAAQKRHGLPPSRALQE